MQSKTSKNELEKDSESLESIALQKRLEMTFEERIEAHENARRFFEDLKLAGEEKRAKSQKDLAPQFYKSV